MNRRGPAASLVNFGRIVGSGASAVTFATPGVQSVSAAITSNMGSPAVRGRFAGAASEFKVVAPRHHDLAPGHLTHDDIRNPAV